ncbi:MAG TPA: CAP domain-containing protein [Gaiellaceae bacterium]|nr:CAP domain-containing protein [Gaiellaceae bacterium]
MHGAARLLVVLAVLCLAVASLGAVQAGTAATKPTRSISVAPELETEILVELNAIRRAHGLRPLRASSPLGTAARAHSRAMAQHGFFRHESRDGSVFWKRVQRYYGPGGYATWSVGENLLWSTTGLDAKRAVRLWMESPGHRKNILTPRWREVGLSAVVAAAAPGVYGGRDVVIVTSDFGVRL